MIMSGGPIFHALWKGFFFSCGNLFNLLAHVEKIRISVARLSIGDVPTFDTMHTSKHQKKKRNFLPKF